MKPSTLIVMSVGLVVTLVGFLLCLFSKSSIEKKYPDRDLFAYEGDFYEIIDGDTVRKLDFSDVIYKTVNDTVKEVSQDVKVLSVTLKDIDSVEIIGHQSVSEVEVYNMTPGRYACEISSGVITLSNIFDETMIFNYVSDFITNFNGIRRLFNPQILQSKPQKVVINIDDDDVLNRIDLDLTNCKNVVVKNLTCSLDCKVSLNNSNLLFDSCIFKEPEPVFSGDQSGETSDAASSPAGGGANTGEDLPGEDQPTFITHYLTLDMNIRNGSTVETKSCKFSSINAVVNKRAVTQKDVDDNPEYTSADIGKYINSDQLPCTIKLDLSAYYEKQYGFDLTNVKTAKNADRPDLVTTLDGSVVGGIYGIYKENAGDPDYPQITVLSSDCAITINH